jgi:S-methylmethionine-dependent homocysteine/selenocysteine methylase
MSALLPQMAGPVFLADGGIETDLIFNRGIDLPHFASFVLHGDPEGEEVIRRYFRDYLAIGERHGHGLVLETLTWRASPDWGDLLGYDALGLYDVNRRAAELLLDLRANEGNGAVVVSGCIGPRGDAYTGWGDMSADQAAEYHGAQVATLAASGVDLISALTLTNAAEATGIALAARHHGIPAVISFTVETDGRLPDGTDLVAAIEAVDRSTERWPSYYMINCAHPDHFAEVVTEHREALGRVGGIRANASRLSHRELDERPDLDDGDPVEFGSQLASLRAVLPRLTVLGGCCGTDHRHIEQIALALGAV